MFIFKLWYSYTYHSYNQRKYRSIKSLWCYSPALEIPSVSVSTTNMTFQGGQNITLRCLATGYPPPDIRWTKDGRDLPPSPRTLIRDNGQLVILDATEDNEGIYTCTAINAAGMDGIQITVRYSGEFV